MSAPNSINALITGASGRSCERASPSKAISPRARAASGGKKRITVPAFPTSILFTATKGRGEIEIDFGCSSIQVPMARNPATISELSRE